MKEAAKARKFHHFIAKRKGNLTSLPCAMEFSQYRSSSSSPCCMVLKLYTGDRFISQTGFGNYHPTISRPLKSKSLVCYIAVAKRSYDTLAFSSASDVMCKAGIRRHEPLTANRICPVASLRNSFFFEPLAGNPCSAYHFLAGTQWAYCSD